MNSKIPDSDDKRYLDVFIQMPCDSTITEEEIESLVEKIIPVSDEAGVELKVYLLS